MYTEQKLDGTCGSDEILQCIIHNLESLSDINVQHSGTKRRYTLAGRAYLETIGSFIDRVQGSPRVNFSQLCFVIRCWSETDQALHIEERLLLLPLDVSQAPRSNSFR